MNKWRLLEQVINVLSSAGFVNSERCHNKPKSFDLAARKEKILLLLNILSNIDGMGEESANELKLLAKHMLGSPLIIGERTRNKMLRTGVVYQRYGVPSINVQTLYDYFVDGVPPYVYAGPGGLYVDINNKTLREARISRNMSLGDLASELGVSRRCISKYEEGMDVTIEKGLRLEEILKTVLVEPLFILKETQIDDVHLDFDELSDLEQNILTSMVDIGFNVFPTTKAPFNAVSTDDENTILTGISMYTGTMVKRAKLVSSISRVAMMQSVFIVEGDLKTSKIEDTVIIKRDELDRVDDSGDFVDLVENKKCKKAI
ncbi:MAG: transcriptional regulator [Halobacteriota archaeon]|nr:transcriptional regulator [Halobacteriota archaeon]